MGTGYDESDNSEWLDFSERVRLHPQNHHPLMGGYDPADGGRLQLYDQISGDIRLVQSGYRSEWRLLKER
jgi:hypothetical protein